MPANYSESRHYPVPARLGITKPPTPNDREPAISSSLRSSLQTGNIRSDALYRD
ncbi:hypothetical protein [Microcoleus vaginatus]|uniref:hypothetical protein n=1 Tax=Microcoleus vaginatus TaxID=119532 RepID=UPI0002FB95EA